MRQAGRLAVLFAVVLLTAGYSVAGMWPAVASGIAIGALWIGGDWFDVAWANGAAFVSCAGACLFGVWAEVPPIWMVMALAAALAAWDLLRFADQLRAVERVDDAAAVRRTYLRRLLLAVVPGALLGAVSQLFRVDLSFAWALLLAALAIAGLSRSVDFIQRRSD